MIFAPTALTVIFSVAFVILAILSFYFWRRRDWDGGIYLSLLFVAGTVWAFFSTLEMATADMSMKIIFAKLTYTGVVSAMPLWFLFTLAYSQRSRWIGWKRILLLWVLPAAILLLTFTNEWHGLEWASVALSPGEPGAVLIYEPGPGEWVLMAYSYALALAGIMLLLNFLLSTYKQYFGQTIMLLIGALVPVAGNLLFSIGAERILPVDPTPITMAAMGLIYAWSTLRYKLFDLVPVARERLITDMAEGIIVIDGKGRIIDINPAARRMMGTDIALGQPAELLLKRWPGLAEDIRCLKEDSREICMDAPGCTRWLDVRATPIRDGHGQVTGRLVTMLDITKRKAAEMALEGTRRNFQSMFDTVDDLFLVIDEDKKIAEINNAVTRRLGYSRDEAIGMSVLDLFPPEERKIAIESMGRMPLDHLAVGIGELHTKDGSTIYVDTHLVASRWGGKPATFAISRDVTERKRAEEALKASENLYRAIFETTGAGTMIVRQDMSIMLANSEFSRLSGYTAAEAESMKLTDFVFKDDMVLLKQYHDNRRIEPTMAPQVYEFRFVDRSGKIHYCINNVGLISGTTMSVASVVDITDRVLAERSLRDSETLYRAVFKNTGAATVIIAPDATIMLANDGWERLTGLPRDALENRIKWTVFFEKEEAERMMKFHRDRREDPSLAPAKYECRPIDYSGRAHYCIAYVDMIPGTVNSVASLIDITERKHAEEDLKESQEKFRTLAETTSGSIFIIQDDKYVYANRSAARFSGYSPEEMAGKGFLDLVHPDDREIVMQRAIARQKGESLPSQYEIRYVCKDGSIRWAEINAGLIEYNHRPALVLNTYDITGHKESEQKILASLKEKEVLLKEIHHRVKNNLQIITSLLSLQISGEIREDLREAFRSSQDRIRSMALIHEKLYQSGDLSSIDFRDYLESLAAALRRAYVHDASIQIDIDVKDVSLGIDTAIPCGLIINELVTNSLKHAFNDGHGGTVRIAMTPVATGDEYEYTLTVSDDGPGLPPDIDLWNSPSLGLRLVNALASQLGGSVEVLPAPGTMFVIRFRER